MKITKIMRMNIDMPMMFVVEPNLISSSATGDVGADVGPCVRAMEAAYVRQAKQKTK